VLVGRAVRIDTEGRLVVEQEGEFESTVSAGDVVHVR
jgi:BirA family biotin operon repressor/biotin-[acetyl-CoA-carboxylase] ligase